MRVLVNIERVARRALARRAELDYAAQYEDLAAWAATDEEIIGPGDFDATGRRELSVLVAAGLRPTHALVDFGCGTGRLARQAIPFLAGGEYVGIEITEAILERARRNVAAAQEASGCRVTWLASTARAFPLDDASADMICAFSVFTHMEHEDSYRYLRDARRVVRPGGRFVLSCLPLELDVARRFFEAEAEVPLDVRWGRVRTVTTSRDYMDAIAALAGWNVVSWQRGDEPAFAVPGEPDLVPFGQSVCVLERSRDG